jgi:hypothetical protein
MGIEMTPVVSSNISAFGYDPETQVLDVQFVNSTDTYSFDDVPQSVADGFKTASSPGQYFRNNVKGKYRFVRG